MRIQIYFGKSEEDQRLGKALEGLPGPELKELLALGLAAKNSTTKPEHQVTTGDSSKCEEVCTTKPEGEIDTPVFSTRNSPTPAEIPTTNFDTQAPEPVSEEAGSPGFVDTGEYPPLGSDQAVKEWEEEVAARQFAAKDFSPRPAPNLPMLPPEEITAEGIQQANDAWKRFIETGELTPKDNTSET